VIVDATFLKREQRRPFQQLARDRNAGFAIVHCSADIETLRERLLARSEDSGEASDADTSVMERQLSQAEPPGAGEPSVRAEPGNPLRWEALEAMVGQESEPQESRG
jgi:uncharacterized protein